MGIEIVITQMVEEIVERKLAERLAELEAKRPRGNKQNIARSDKELRTYLGISQTTLTRMNQRHQLDSARLKIGRRRNGYDLDIVNQILKLQ